MTRSCYFIVILFAIFSVRCQCHTFGASNKTVESNHYSHAKTRNRINSSPGSESKNHKIYPNNSSLKDYNQEELQFRLEYIKLQILQKLGMDRVPKIKRKDMDNNGYHQLLELQEQQEQELKLNELVGSRYNGINARRALSREPETPFDDDNDKVFVFPMKEYSTSTSETYNLTLNYQASKYPIKSIKLFVKQNWNMNSFNNEILVMTSVPSWKGNSSADKIIGLVKTHESRDDELNLHSHHNMVNPSVKWKEYDLTDLLMKSLKRLHTFRPYRDDTLFIIDSKFHKIYSSFIKMDYDYNISNRKKRSIDCNENGNSSTCCREPFYVNFTTISWDNWILQPAGYNANYCKGKCDISHARYHHTTVVQKYPSIISMCCSPREMSHISLIYVDEDGYVFQKNLPNMVVESCDCA